MDHVEDDNEDLLGMMMKMRDFPRQVKPDPLLHKYYRKLTLEPENYLFP